MLENNLRRYNSNDNTFIINEKKKEEGEIVSPKLKLISLLIKNKIFLSF